MSMSGADLFHTELVAVKKSDSGDSRFSYFSGPCAWILCYFMPKICYWKISESYLKGEDVKFVGGVCIIFCNL